MSAVIIIASTQNMANANIGPGPVLWILQAFICLFIFIALTFDETAGKILVAWLIVSIPLFMWLF